MKGGFGLVVKELRGVLVRLGGFLVCFYIRSLGGVGSLGYWSIRDLRRTGNGGLIVSFQRSAISCQPGQRRFDNRGMRYEV